MRTFTRIKNGIGRRIYEIIVSKLYRKNIVITRSLVNLNRKRIIQTMFPDVYSDYIRLAVLELCAEEIKKREVAGSVAEVGVYRGDFAKHLNLAFSDRKLFLFDTSTGFVDEELEADMKEGLANPKDFRSDVDAVMALMPHNENVFPVVGKFDRSSLDILPSDEKFSLVSIDLDLYEPTIESLKAFYARLSPHGYLFIHDYNSDRWKGVAKAIDEFVEETGACFFPLPDAQGTIIITK